MYSYLGTHRVLWDACWESQTGACMREAAANNNYRDRLDSFLLSGDSYLVDLASSHMLVSKIKPCMSKFKPNFFPVPPYMVLVCQTFQRANVQKMRITQAVSPSCAFQDGAGRPCMH